MNLIATFLGEAERRAAQTAIIDGRGRAITFGDIAARSAALAGAWQSRGIGRGDRVILAMPLGIGLYVALAALWRLGAVVVFPEPAMGLVGLRHGARATAPKAFLASGWYRALGVVLPELRRVPLRLTPNDAPGAPVAPQDVGEEHPALISFTSGSTGAPKAIARSHGFLAAQNAAVARLLRPRREDEVDLVAFPVFVIANLGLGVTSVLPGWNLKRHDTADAAAIARQIERHHVTRGLLPPSVCARLTQLARMPALTAIFTGGGPVFPDLMLKLAAQLPDADIVAVYGSTEAEPITHLHVRDIGAEDWEAMRTGAGLLAGTPIPEIQLWLDDGEIVVTGDHVNKGYLDSRQDSANKVWADGRIWHRTGDAGRIDGKGRLWLLGRHEQRIGPLYPFAVEVAARTWPGARAAALARVDGRAVLAIEGDRSCEAEWRRRAATLGDVAVTWIDAVPLDRRHRSKVDYARLAAKLGGAP